MLSRSQKNDRSMGRLNKRLHNGKNETSFQREDLIDDRFLLLSRVNIDEIIEGFVRQVRHIRNGSSDLILRKVTVNYSPTPSS
jgi:hypothetical protein